jgi:HAD superfamily hydrolase (TIGR01509 family)
MEGFRKAGGQITEPLPEDRTALFEIERRWNGCAIEKIGPRPGLQRLLTQLSQTTTQVALSDYQAGHKLEALGLRNHFTAVYSGEDFGFLKPNPKLFQLIASEFKINTSSILHIGDRVDTDRAAAEAAGSACLILGRDFQNFRALAMQMERGRLARFVAPSRPLQSL